MNPLTDLWATDDEAAHALGIPTDRDLVAPTTDTTRDLIAPPMDSRNTATDPRGKARPRGSVGAVRLSIDSPRECSVCGLGRPRELLPEADRLPTRRHDDESATDETTRSRRPNDQ